ncbi:MAG TPA: glycosyltransferase [Casimicrobiaceae bacterium]|jgi:glycosyltransferase involved in cell wall biosynthesis|nr:glycosyltransferase [Casimicrobiaceae bacterium]
MSSEGGQGALLIADSDIPTTRLVARELREAFASLEVRIAPDIFGAVVTDRPVIVSRLCYPRYSWLPGHLSREGVRYAYFIDDNFWEITPEIDVRLASFFRDPATVDTLDAFVRHAAVVLTWSQPLRDYVASRFSDVRSEFVAPGFDVAKAAALLQRHPPPTDGEDAVVRIGYPTTPRPRVSALVVPVVEHFLRVHGRSVKFEFIGWMPEALGGLPNVEFHPWIGDYDKYLEFKVSRRWHIGIAPLIGDGFEKYKTNNKYREYGGCMVPGVYSDVSPFRETVDDGKTGILVDNNAGAWIGALEKLVAFPVLRSAIAREAFEDVRRHHDLRTTGRHLVDAVLRHGVR